MMASPLSSFDPDFAAPAEWAAMYRTHGLQVVPARYPMRTAQDKRPALAEWTMFQENLASEAVFTRWFSPDAKPNMGVITGRASGNLVVIDIDEHTKDSARLWWQGLLVVEHMGGDIETWTQVTGGGGRQLFFLAPFEWHTPTNKTPLGVDIRGQGGFAMLPPSVHLSGKQYAWAPGLAPWETDIATAPQWLLDAIDRLVEQYGGDKGNSSGGERTPAPSTDFNAFGARIDGREDALTKWVWAAVVDLHRSCAGVLTDDDGRKAFEAALDGWLRHARTRLPGIDNATGLERECRGASAFLAKWQRAMRKWETRVREDAEKERPSAKKSEPKNDDFEKEFAQAETPKGIRTFDFANLILAEVPETPDLIEPNLLGESAFCLVGGPPKAQKSWFVQDMLVSCATGQPFLSSTFTVPRPLRVFYLQAEMNEKLLRRRAKAITGLADEHIDMLASNLIVSDRFRMILDQNGVMTAVNLIKSQFPPDEPPDILAFDPMANLFDQENENDNAQVMKFLTTRIEAVRQLVNPVAGVVLVHHATKKGPDEIRKDPFNCFRGGGALRGHYDSGIIIFRKSDDAEEREMHFELRAGETPEPMTVRLEGGRMVRADVGRFGIVTRTTDKKGWPEAHVLRSVLDAVSRAWTCGTPWSSSPISRNYGRYMPALLGAYGISEKVGKDIMHAWLANGLIDVQIANSDTKMKGLRVLRTLDSGD